jgi:L-Ala-D/L-Glu epimerase
MEVDIRTEHWALNMPFRITGHVFEGLDVIVVTLREGDLEGRGEAASVYYWNTTPASMTTQINGVRREIEAGIDRNRLRELLPPGSARNAVDCALWDLEAKRSGRPVWQLADLPRPRPLLTTYTLGADEPERMAQAAQKYVGARALKLKLTGEALDSQRVRAVREARPDAWIGVDANQGFTVSTLEGLMPALVESNVRLIEQPFAVGREADLQYFDSPIPIAADESVQSLDDLVGLVDLFQVINIKLDKCGGLTEGLMMAREAQRLGLKTMVGNMFGTSLAMAPGFVLGQLCEVVDLDGPIEFVADRTPAAVYTNGEIWCPEELWGGPASVST